MRISWTKYSTKEECSLRYNLVYVRRIPERRSRLVFLVGSVVHDTIRSWAQSGYEVDFIQRKVVEEFKLQSVGINFKSKGTYIMYLQRAIKGALVAQEIYKQLQFKDHGAIVEFRFKAELFESGMESALLNGASDVYDPIRKSIYDMKLNTSMDSVDRGQLLTYAVAFQCMGHEVERGAFIQPIRPNKLIKFEFTNDEIHNHKLLLQQSAAEMQQGVIPVANIGCKACFFCGYKGSTHCPGKD